MSLIQRIIAILFYFCVLKAAPIEDVDPLKYLLDYGWLSAEGGNIAIATSGDEKYVKALEDFQAFAGLNVSGVVDKETLRVMDLPRCGSADTEDKGLLSMKKDVEAFHKRVRRFALQGTRWKTRELHYNISKYPSKSLSPPTVDLIINQAFKQWENAANISFFKFIPGRSPKVHIDVRFEQRFHGDEEIFDGPGGTTAHAYFPEFGGGVHFDEEEEWTVNSESGVNLFQVATHEIGHALGLEHSNNQESVMAPFYRTYRKDFKLFQDDIEAIQALYGKRTHFFCDEGKIDAATRMGDGLAYIFKGTFVYRFTSEGEVVDWAPTAISVAFPGLPNNLDAGITRSNNISYFFKGPEFWRVTNMKVDPGFPKQISETFPGIEGALPLDSAFQYSEDDDNLYFFRGKYFWTFNPFSRNGTYSTLPKPRQISELFQGVPGERVDAILSLRDGYGNSFSLWFKDNFFWKFNHRSKSVYLSDPPYPKTVSRNLFGCT